MFSETKQRLLDLRLQGVERRESPIVAGGRPDRIPLSFAQQRLWFLDQLEPGSTGYVVPAPLRLRGRLDVAALQAALDEVVARHEILRTRLVAAADGDAHQVVDPPRPFDLRLLDLSGAVDGEARAGELVDADTRRPFDLAAGPLLRGRLIRIADDDHVLSLVMHHVVSDEWSAGVLHRELSSLYDAFARGEGSPLAPLAVQYADVALWQRSRLQGDAVERQIGYWRERLAGLPTLELPTDRPRAASASSAGDVVRFPIPAATVDGLRAVSRERGATLFMTLLAGWSELLGRYAAQDDVVVGTPIANRNRAEVEPLIGLFINTLVMRTDRSGDPTFAELVSRVRAGALDAYGHQDVPFEQIVDVLAPERDRSRSPLFQVLFDYAQGDPVAADGAGWGGLDVTGMETSRHEAVLDLILLVADEPDGGLTAVLEYRTELFTRATVERLGGHLVRLLDAVARDPEARLSSHELLDDVERRRLLVGWNGADRERRTSGGLHELVAARAAKHPDRTAVVFGDVELSYGELEARAARVARRLRSLGVGPEVVVGLGLDRGVDVVVALLAVLKAGGAYLPIDPDLPADRRAFMLDDSGAALLVDGAFLDAGSDPGDDDGGLPVAVGSDGSACVIYTSGSTGRPKGVQVTHGGLLGVLDGWTDAWLPSDPGLRWLSLTSVGFDVFTGDVVRALGTGGTLVVAPEGLLLDVDALHRTLVGQRIEAFECAPRFLDELVDAGDPPADLRLVVVTTDTWRTARLERARRVLGPDVRLVTAFGITETTIDTTFGDLATVEPEPDPVDRMTPIGAPLAGTRCAVLDRHLRPVPVGARGELHIGGVGLARGYGGRPALTAERFVADPFATDGRRLYRSGDAVRWRSDGQLEFLGRLDDQLNIRGFRVEPGEIEAALVALPAVAAAVVVGRPDGVDRRLVAYVVPADPAVGVPPTDELRAALAATLPEHMVPGHVVELDRIPVTPHGKVDRAALPAVDSSRPRLAAGPVAPVSATEEVVAGLWAEVLGVDEVGRHDNFFDLGGHSLLATRMVSRLRATFGMDVPLADVFDHPTVAGLAAVVDAGVRGAAVPPIVPVDRDAGAPLPPSFAQQRLWFLDQLEPDSVEYNVPAAVRLQGELDVAALRAAFDAVVERHEVLRTRLPAVDGAPVQVIDEPAGFELAIVDVDSLEEAATQVGADAVAPFDLATGPLFRGRLLRLSPEDHVLSLVMHHVVSDEWSAGVLHRELSVLYDAFRRGEPSPLPPLAVQYADFAAWQRAWLQGEVLDAQLTYWRDRLAGAPVLDLPTDRPRPAVQSSAGALVEFAVRDETVAALQRLSRQTGSTLFMTLLAGFNVLLGRYAGQDDVVVGTPIANRNRAEIEGLIGFFVNTLVMRTDLGGDPTFAEVVERVRQQALRAYAHQDLPFEQLVEDLQPERDRSRSPLFQVLFNYEQGGLGDRTDLGGLTLSGFGTPGETTLFDLALFLVSGDDGLGGWIEYSTELFDRDTVERMVGHLAGLLDQVAADPRRPLSELPVLDPAERRQLAAWNATAVPRPPVGVHDLVARRALADPGATALILGDDELSYGELDQRADRLARYLRALGVGPDVAAGLVLDRSFDLVVAQLAVLKAGGAYVPVDPEYPTSRQHHMLRDCRAAVVVGHRAGLEPLDVDGVAVALDDPATAALIADRPDDGPPVPFDAAQLAYVIYTSGSTGRPKGVMVHHRGLTNVVSWLQETYGLTPADRVLQQTAFGFDVGSAEILWPLTAGAALVLAEPKRSGDVDHLHSLIARHRITVMDCVPSLFHLLVDDDRFGAAADLRLVACAGEALSGEDVARAHAAHPTVRIENIYGPTEASVYASWWSCGRDDPSTSPPIGRPVANTRLHVVDRSLAEVAVGVPGELLLGGVGVARGYLGRPALTAERFVADPCAADGSRLYRTGDRVRRRSDGALDYQGRLDHQVKVRGFRIEPGEVEAALLGHPAVAAAVVVARDDLGSDGGDRRLVGYVVPGELPDEVRAEASEAQVDEWRQIYDREHAAVGPALRFDDFSGWVSSYDGEAIALADMREWRDAMLDAIRELAPRRVLELGVGTGLILGPLAPECEAYWATDFSAPVVDNLRDAVEGRPDLAGRVELRHGAAHETDGLPRAWFDTVVVNSVAQYFPDLDYFDDVVTSALELLAPGGTLFLGDLRHRGLHDVLHTEVQLGRLADTATAADVRLAVERAIRLEKELLIDPGYFVDLPARLPGVAGVDVRVKRGRHHNELTRYRYDAVVHKAGGETAPRSLAGVPTVDWPGEVEGLRDVLAGRPEPLRVTAVPNARLRGPVGAQRALMTADDDDPEAALAVARACLAGCDGVEAEDLHQLGDELGYRVLLTWGAADDRYDALFLPAGEPGGALTDLYRAPPGPSRPWANDPASGETASRLVPWLRAHLAPRLPEFMVPTTFVVLDALPLNANGKVDRARLPAPEAVRPELTVDYVAPRTVTEELLAGIWAELLGLDRVGVGDDFFDLGGHSLLATRAVSRVGAALGVDVALAELFDHPTVAELAAVVERAGQGAAPAGPIPAGERPAGSRVPLSFAQQRLWFVEQLAPGSADYNVPIALRLSGPLDAPALAAALDAVVDRHEILRTRLVAVDGVPAQVVDPVGRPLSTVDLGADADPEARAEQLVAEDAAAPFDLEGGPLLRARLLRLGPEDHVLSLVLHHLVCDEWSLGVLSRELSVLYEACSRGRPSPLAPLPVQYADFAVWQRGWLQGEQIERQLAYWRDRLAGAPVLDLRTDRPRPAVPSSAGAAVSFVVPAQTADRLRAVSRQAGATMFMTLLGALGVLVGRYAGQDDVVVGAPIANRTRSELEGLIGLFVNTLLFRLDLSGDPTFPEVVRRAREVALGAYAHQDLPFEQVVDAAGAQRDHGGTALLRVLFNYGEGTGPERGVTNLDAAGFGAAEVVAPTDLRFVLLDEEDGSLRGAIEYRTALFEPPTIERMARHWRGLLDAVVTDG